MARGAEEEFCESLLKFVKITIVATRILTFVSGRTYIKHDDLVGHIRQPTRSVFLRWDAGIHIRT